MNNKPTNNITENLRANSLDWNSDFIENNGISQIILNGKIGEGTVTGYEITPELACLVYDATFFEEVRFFQDKSHMNPVYFLYCLEGDYYHKFSDDENVQKLSRLQNVIVASGKSTKNIIALPANVKLKISVILIFRDQLNKNKKFARPFLIPTLKEIIAPIPNKYKYFGSIHINASKFAEILIHNKRIDAVGRLTTEAAVLNLLKAQIEIFTKRNTIEKLPLKEKELNTIVSMSHYISNHISEKLTIEKLYKHTRLSPQKLQAGTKFLYGESLNSFIRTLRLEYAKDLLLTTNMNISEILYEVGFSSRGYFSKIFKERFGFLPNEYAKHINAGSNNFELSYKSNFTENTSLTDIEEIIKISRNRNKKLNVTGCLIVYQKTFFQILEGSKKNVLKVYKSIENDSRHQNIQLIWKGVRINRLFEDWSMALVSEKGNLNIHINGELKFINIKELIKSKEDETIAMEVLWRRVRNILKVS